MKYAPFLPTQAPLFPPYQNPKTLRHRHLIVQSLPDAPANLLSFPLAARFRALFAASVGLFQLLLEASGANFGGCAELISQSPSLQPAASLLLTSFPVALGIILAGFVSSFLLRHVNHHLKQQPRLRRSPSAVVFVDNGIKFRFPEAHGQPLCPPLSL